MDLNEKAAYVRREIHEIKDLLDDYKNVKCIYEALLEYTITLGKLEGREGDEGDRIDLQTWLNKLRVLDPMRAGRWKDIKAQIGVQKRSFGYNLQPLNYNMTRLPVKLLT